MADRHSRTPSSPQSPDPRLVPDRNRPGAWLVRIDGTDQSYIDPYDPTYLEFDYVQRVAAVIDTTWPAGQRITALHVGGAAMAIPRYLAATRPTSAQIVFEPDASLTEAVRAVAPLPRQSGIKVRALDGWTGLTAMPDAYADLVVVDAFAGAQVPAELGTTGWFTLARRVIRPGGTIVVNLTDHAPFSYSRRVIAGIAAGFDPVLVGAEPSTLKGRRFGNIVVAAGGDLVEPELTRRAAGAAFPYRILYGQELTSWLGGAKPYSQADAEPSPEPPYGLFGADR